MRTSKNPDKGKISPPLVVAPHETVIGEVEIYKTEAVQSVNHDRLAHVKGDFLVLVSVVMAADKRHYALVYNSEGR